MFALTAFAVLATLSGCVTDQHVYLTWQGDTSTTMTVNYQVLGAPEDLTVYWDTEPREGDLASYANQTKANAKTIPLISDERHIVSAELTGLEPGGTYYFALGGRPGAGERKFRTIPDDGSPIRFIAGGDMGPFFKARNLLEQAAKHDPHFAVIGGDLAYANGEPENDWIWDRWIQNYGAEMVTSDGCMIPMILGIGNHEINDLEGPPEVRSPFYYGYFPQGGKTYFTRTFGPDVVLIVLDTGHIVPHADQVDWLSEQLEAHKEYPVKFSSYHVPQYPSHRSFSDSRSVAARELWAPLFDQYGLTAGFEHHDHTFKRTKPIRGGEVDPEGTLYLGDGSMGIPTRDIENADAWYIEKASSTAHFWLVEASREGVDYRAVNVQGEVFDRYPETE
jgi:hypothetical protein